MTDRKDLSQLKHAYVDGPLHFYYETADDGTRILRHIRAQQHTFEVPADGVTLDTVPENSVGTRQIENEGVMLEDLNQEVRDQMADRVTGDEIDKFKV